MVLRRFCEKHKLNQFHTAPTAIRALTGRGNEPVEKHDLSSLKVLGTGDEPINPGAWNWYDRVVGKERCPMVDTWWQTETGGHLLTPLPQHRGWRRSRPQRRPRDDDRADLRPPDRRRLRQGLPRQHQAAGHVRNL